MSSDLRARLEKLMAFDIVAANDQARIECHTMLRDNISRGDAQLKARNVAEWQHKLDLEVLRKMAACLEKCVEAIDSLEGHMPVGADVFDTAKNHAASARAEIARLVSDK